MLVRKLGSETHEGKQLDIMQCSRMHPNRTIIITQVICIYKSITINIIMLVRKLGSETHEGKQLDIMQCSRMHPNRNITITNR
jgi:hypothetical protein